MSGENGMRLYGIRIFVEDFNTARRFYREMLGLPENWAMPEMKAVGFYAGSAELIIEETDPDGGDGNLIGRFAGVSLRVDDIDAVYRSLAEKGVRFRRPPEKQAWGGTLAHFDDPAGNTLTLLG